MVAVFVMTISLTDTFNLWQPHDTPMSLHHYLRAYESGTQIKTSALDNWIQIQSEILNLTANKIN